MNEKGLLLGYALKVKAIDCTSTKNPHYISKMYSSHWMTPGVSERMWSANLDASFSGEYQTLGGHSGRPSEYLGSLRTDTAVPWQ